MKAFLTLLLAALLPAMAARAAEPVSGLATVIDGSTLTVKDKTYRLLGATAPGRQQTCLAGGASWDCGNAAAKKLQALIGGNSVRCSEVEQGTDDRPLAICYAGGVELNRAMVASGLAVSRWQIGLDYSEPQEVAKASRIGLWAGSFEDPWKWRQEHAAPAKKPAS